MSHLSEKWRYWCERRHLYSVSIIAVCCVAELYRKLLRWEHSTGWSPSHSAWPPVLPAWGCSLDHSETPARSLSPSRSEGHTWVWWHSETLGICSHRESNIVCQFVLNKLLLSFLTFKPDGGQPCSVSKHNRQADQTITPVPLVKKSHLTH